MFLKTGNSLVSIESKKQFFYLDKDYRGLSS